MRLLIALIVLIGLVSASFQTTYSETPAEMQYKRSMKMYYASETNDTRAPETALKLMQTSANTGYAPARFALAIGMVGNELTENSTQILVELCNDEGYLDACNELARSFSDHNMTLAIHFAKKAADEKYLFSR